MTGLSFLSTTARTACAVVAFCGPGLALDVADCTRIIHVSHGGEADHADLGQGWVSWTEWWSQEGVYHDLKVADCRDHRLLTARLHEERIGDGSYDRRARGQEAFERYTGRSPAFWRLDELGEALDRAGGVIAITDISEESCACAAFYPNARRELQPFALN